MTALGDVLGAARARPAAELLDLDPLALECEMRGHPWIVASKGRLGFGASDLLAYAPEAAQPLRLGWLAATPRSPRRGVDGLDHATVVREQVGEADWALLRERAAAAGLDPDAARTCRCTRGSGSTACCALHAGAIARGELVALGTLDAPLPAGPVDPHARRRRPPASAATSSSRSRSSTPPSTAGCRATARSPRRR